nr:TonB-dependent receptor [Kofleriaceae bacterium]
MRSWIAFPAVAVAVAAVSMRAPTAHAQVANVADAPVLGTTIDRSELELLPISGSSLDAVLATAALAPGAHADLAGVGYAGGTSPENRYYIDGFDTTSVVTGQLATPLSTDFVQRVGVATGGLDATIDASTGAVVGVSTRKAQTDDLHGSAFIYYQPGWLVARGAAIAPATAGAGITTAESFDDATTVGGELGGRVAPHLYVHAGVAASLDDSHLVRTVTRSDGTAIAHDAHGERGEQLQAIGSIDYQRGPRRVGIEAIALPSTQSEPAIAGVAPAATTISGVTSDVIAHAETFEHGHLQLAAVVGWHHDSSSDLPTDASLDGTPRIDMLDADLGTIAGETAAVRAACANHACPIGVYPTGGAGAISRTAEDRLGGTASATYFGRAHAVVVGVDAYGERASTAQALTGGEQIRRLLFDGATIDTDAEEIRTTSTGLTTVAGGLDDPAAQVHAHGVRGAAYAQDTWTIDRWVQVRGGVRYSAQRVDVVDEIAGLVDPRTGRPYDALSLSGLAPSLGVIVDPSVGTRTYLFFASWNRALETVPLDVARGLGGDDLQVGTVPSGGFTPSPGIPLASRVAAGTRDQAIDDYVAGFSGQPRPRLVVTAAYHARRLVRALEDASDPLSSQLLLTNPTASRDYDALELTATYRLADRWTARASYTYARTAGSYEGLLDTPVGQLDPNQTEAFDRPQLETNRLGTLPQDIPQTLVVDATYRRPLGGGVVTVSAGLRAQSGAPRTPLGNDPGEGVGAIALLPAGTFGRDPAQASLDAHVGYRHALSRSTALTVFVDVFDVLDRQSAIVDDQYQDRAGLTSTQGVSGGTYADLIWLRDLRSDASEIAAPVERNPRFGRPLAYTAPTFARLGARLSF